MPQNGRIVRARLKAQGRCQRCGKPSPKATCDDCVQRRCERRRATGRGGTKRCRCGHGGWKHFGGVCVADGCECSEFQDARFSRKRIDVLDRWKKSLDAPMTADGFNLHGVTSSDARRAVRECYHDHSHKHGKTRRGKQRFKCCDCKRTWSEELGI
jgi:hypothetical protein